MTDRVTRYRVLASVVRRWVRGEIVPCLRTAREADVALEVGVSTRLLRCWGGKPGGRFKPPNETDAEKVETGVRALLQDCLARLSGEEF